MCAILNQANQTVSHENYVGETNQAYVGKTTCYSVFSVAINMTNPEAFRHGLCCNEDCKHICLLPMKSKVSNIHFVT